MKKLSRLLLTVLLAGFFLLFPLISASADSDYVSNNSIVKMSGDIYVNEGNVVNGDVVTVNGNVYINGSVNGNVVSVFGDIVINGKVVGDVTSVTGRITIGNNGKVLGNTTEALSGVSSGERGGINIRPGFHLGSLGNLGGIMLSFFTCIGKFILLCLIYLIMPHKSDYMADDMENNIGKKFGIGLVTIIGSPVAMVILSIILVITIIGVLLLPVVWLAFILAIIVATLVALVPAYIFIGKKAAMMIARKDTGSYAALAIGVFTIWFFEAIISIGGLFTSWINLLVSLFILSIGVGSLVQVLYSGRKKRNSKNNNNSELQGSNLNNAATSNPEVKNPD